MLDDRNKRLRDHIEKMLSDHDRMMDEAGLATDGTDVARQDISDAYEQTYGPELQSLIMRSIIKYRIDHPVSEVPAWKDLESNEQERTEREVIDLGEYSSKTRASIQKAVASEERNRQIVMTYRQEMEKGVTQETAYLNVSEQFGMSGKNVERIVRKSTES